MLFHTLRLLSFNTHTHTHAHTCRSEEEADRRTINKLRDKVSCGTGCGLLAPCCCPGLSIAPCSVLRWLLVALCVLSHPQYPYAHATATPPQVSQLESQLSGQRVARAAEDAGVEGKAGAASGVARARGQDLQRKGERLDCRGRAGRRTGEEALGLQCKLEEYCAGERCAVVGIR